MHCYSKYSGASFFFSFLHTTNYYVLHKQQVNKALQQRVTDITKTNNELKETVESMNIRESKNKFSMIDKFVQLLNYKKRKIYTLEQQIKMTNEKLSTANEQLKKRKRSDEQIEVSVTSERRVKQQKIVKETKSLPLPPVEDESDDSEFCDSDDMDCPQTVR